MSGHRIQAIDGEICHVKDIVIDEDNWSIRYLVVATENLGKKRDILLPPQWIGRISWEESKVYVDISSDVAMRSPEYLPGSLTRDYEGRLYRHYDKKGYWTDGQPPAAG